MGLVSGHNDNGINFAYGSDSASPKQPKELSYLLDHRVSLTKQRGWDCEAERLRGFEVNHQFKLGSLLDGKVAWLGATQYLIDVLRTSRHAPRKILAIPEEKPILCPTCRFANRWDPMAQREFRDVPCVLVVQRVR